MEGEAAPFAQRVHACDVLFFTACSFFCLQTFEKIRGDPAFETYLDRLKTETVSPDKFRYVPMTHESICTAWCHRHVGGIL